MSHPRPAVFISPGGSGDPGSPKLLRLAEAARARDLYVEVLDGRQIQNPEVRVEKLLESRAREYEHRIFAGCSMGGYVSAVAAEKLEVEGLFLISPVLYLPPYANLDPQPGARSISMVHGWQDSIVPPENVYQFARRFGADLHFLSGGHSLEEQMLRVEVLFGQFLDTCLQEINRLAETKQDFNDGGDAPCH